MNRQFKSLVVSLLLYAVTLSSSCGLGGSLLVAGSLQGSFPFLLWWEAE